MKVWINRLLILSVALFILWTIYDIGVKSLMKHGKKDKEKCENSEIVNLQEAYKLTYYRGYLSGYAEAKFDAKTKNWPGIKEIEDDAMNEAKDYVEYYHKLTIRTLNE